jgi:hypothetical protein
MPSLSEVIGVIVTVFVLLAASGRQDLAWKAIGEMRKIALVNARSDWGCPSVFNRQSACNSYDPNRYR